MEQEKRLCQSCGKVLKGRVDKKFCDDTCRNNYNNVQNSDRNNYVRNVNTILRKNRKILEVLLPSGEKTANIARQKLREKGFDFNYQTSVLQTQKGTYTFCYEYGYLPLDGDWLLLVKRKD
jgi:hypothetical protein